jgi:hypothetical protein
MKYYVFWGDYLYDLEMMVYETEQEALDAVIKLKDNGSYEIVRAVRGDELNIQASYKFREKNK